MKREKTNLTNLIEVIKSFFGNPKDQEELQNDGTLAGVLAKANLSEEDKALLLKSSRGLDGFAERLFEFKTRGKRGNTVNAQENNKENNNTDQIGRKKEDKEDRERE